jgi:3-dehydroquinate synthase
MKKIIVDLQDRSYPINIGVRLDQLGRYLKGQEYGPKAIVVTNTTLRKRYLPELVKGLTGAGFTVSTAVIPDGEKYKKLSTVEKLYRAALAAKADRSTVVIALGGGVVGDITGFFAATYMRGIPFVQVPTTLLAMVDSSVGGKTGVDLPDGKNLVGAFYQPKAVWIDLDTLKTLPARQLRNGLAEIIKYGAIADEQFFEWLEKVLLRKLADAEFGWMIATGCAIKARVVEKDEFERRSLREILNYGHTFGHAIETLTRYRTWCHGEAVAIGMNLAAKFAVELGVLTAAAQQRIETLLATAGLPVTVPGRLTPRRMIDTMLRDKKVREGKLRLVLPERIGSVKVIAVPADTVREFLVKNL